MSLIKEEKLRDVSDLKNDKETLQNETKTSLLM